MIYKMELSDSVDTMVFDLLEVPIVDKDITGIAENTTIDGNVFNDYLWLKKQYVQKWSIMCQDEYDRLRGFWTRQFGNAEVPFYRLFYGENVYEDKNFLTSDGFTQIMNPTERTAPLSLTHLYGNATQKTLSGKNLFGFAYGYGSTTRSGLTIEVIENGAIKVNGTVTSDMWCELMMSANFLQSLQNTTTILYSLNASSSYTLTVRIRSGTYTMGTGNCNVYVQVDENNTQKASNIGGTPTTFTGSNGIYRGWMRFLTGAVFNNCVLEIQLEQGSTATDYQEFVGGIPSPNPDFPQEIKTVTGAQTVKITGKNLFDKNAITSGYLVSRGVGTLSQNSSYGATDFIPVSAGQQLHFGDDFNRWYSAYYDANKVAIGEPTNTANITIPDGVAYLRTSLLLTNLDTAQLELGTTATAYEPYQAQSQEINLGKNLQPTTWAQDFVDAVNSSSIASIETFDGKNCLSYQPNAGYGSYPTKNFTLGVKFKENTQYTISFDEHSTTSNRHVAFYYTDGTYSTYTATSANTWTRVSMTSTAGKTVAYVAPLYTSGATHIDIDTFQLELGNQATPYAPYKTPIELAKIGTYQDYIWNDDGTWKIHKEVGKVVLDGTNATFAYANNGFLCIYTQANSPFYGKIALGEPSYQSLCDHFTVQPNGITWAGRGKCGFNSAGAFWLMHTDTTITTVAGFNTWLSTHPTTVYYALATPTDTEITDSELIEQLNHVYELYQGQNNLWLISSAGAQGEMDGTYRLIYDEETDIIPKTPVVLTLTDGGVINPCGCRQNIQLIMRETEGE